MTNSKIAVDIKNNKAIKRFVTKLRNRLGDKILGIYLFDNVAKEMATERSDIDILIVYINEDERRILEAASEIAFEINCAEDKIIEVVTMSKEEYLEYAKDGLSEHKIRLAIDTGYNACELLVKSLIVSKKEPLAGSHGGVVGQFGRLFILSGKFSEHLGRNLHLALELRAKARYKPKAALKIEQTQKGYWKRLQK